MNPLVVGGLVGVAVAWLWKRRRPSSPQVTPHLPRKLRRSGRLGPGGNQA